MAKANVFLFKRETEALVDSLTYLYDAIGLINEKEGTSLKASEIIDVEEVTSIVKRSRMNDDPSVEELFELGNTLGLVNEKIDLLKKYHKKALRNLFL